MSTLSVIVTSASTATGNEEVISNLSDVQNRFILFYVSFDKQTIDDEDDTMTTKATIITPDPTTTEAPKAVTGDITEATTTQSPFIIEGIQVPDPIEEIIPEVVITIDNNQPPPLPVTNLHFTLGGQTYLNGSTVSLSDIGEGENALLCVTDNIGCCRTNLEGEFHYPDNSQVPVRAVGESLYRNRGEGFIRLNFNGNAGTPLGRYRCAIPDATDIIQSLFITIQ